jgi:Protein of unknown function DUF262/Restriction Enzyme Adenine Methylase Associated/Protein of unknown function (DUF1524)
MRTDGITGDSYSLRALFDGDTVYTIDYYQREYAWSEDDVRVLVEDLRREYDDYSRHQKTSRSRRQQPPPYFLGPFVYYQDPEGSRFLVDGQQRFTTLHLIFIATRRLLRDQGAAQEAGILDRAIMTFDNRGQRRYRIGIEERVPALNAFYQGRPYEPPGNATLSVRNLTSRAREIEELLDQQLDTEARPGFAVWLLNHVVMVGIRAPSQDNAYRIFETMNDRGARLTSTDLLKSFLLSNAHGDEASLNDRWRQMLGELTAVRDDHDAPARFIKAALTAKYAGVGGSTAADASQIGSALNVWVQKNRDSLRLSGDQSFFRFVDELIGLAARYGTFLAATRRRDEHHGLEAIYFNEVNGMTSQMVLILAAVRHDDTPTVAKEKASRIANFIDRWYVLRVIDDLPVQQDDLEELAQRLLAPLRACRTPEDVTAVLDREVSPEDTPFKAFSAFGKRGNNSHQVRYLLARITAYVAESLGRPNEIERYLDADRSWQIEHIFADHAERHPEIDDPLVFRALRNRLGVLVLLPRRDNNSINDLPYAEKIKTYSRQNDLAAVLNKDHQGRNPTLRDFARSAGVESLFRPFSPQSKLQEIAEVRQELYLRLCEQIWDPARLRIGSRAPERTPARPQDAARSEERMPRPADRPKRKLLQSHVGKLVRAGALQPGEKIVGTHKGTDYWAAIEDDGAIVLSATGARYTRIDEAAREVRQKGGGGMEFWHKEKPGGTRTSLRELLATVT